MSFVGRVPTGIVTGLGSHLMKTKSVLRYASLPAVLVEVAGVPPSPSRLTKAALLATRLRLSRLLVEEALPAVRRSLALLSGHHVGVAAVPNVGASI